MQKKRKIKIPNTGQQMADQTKSMPPSPKWHLPFIFLLCVVAYIPSLSAGFVNWDDGDYVLDNPLIKSFSTLDLLLTTHVQGNHHPVTMLSLSINYLISGMDAWSYHLFNILFHLINCYLVYRFAYLLSYGKSIIAFTVSILFAVHPMHVESVAWISERKDLLYTLFFIAGHITYLKYADTGSKKHYWLTVLLLVLSLLSKPSAVIFPVSLFCIDFLRARKFSFGLIIEKIPFFVLSGVMGIVTLLAQKEAGATEGDPFGMLNNLLFGFYGILMYAVKMIVPVGLSAFYPFPPINENLPVVYYLSPLFTLIILSIAWFTRKKHRYVAFGISFYIINLLLVLQVFSVGSAVIAERYTYVPYIGLFYIIGALVDYLFKNNNQKSHSLIIPVALIFSVLTFLQVKIWHDGASLWDSVIKTNPSSRAYSARATLYRKDKNYSKAIEYYNKAIQMNVIDHESYNNLGNIYMDLNKFDTAYYNYKQSVRIMPEYYTAWDNIGSMFARSNQFDSALVYLTKALEIKPDYRQAYSNRGLSYMQLKRYNEAINDWIKYLQYDPEADDVYNTIGLCYRMIGNHQEALGYINKAIAMYPEGAYYMNRSYTYGALNNTEMARSDALMARQKGVSVNPDWLRSLGLQ